jgi:PAS domain S-box-containing protein
MWVYDLESLQFLEVNDAAVARYGYSRNEFFQMRITDIRPPEETPRLLENLAEDRPVLQTSGPWQHRLKSGEVIRVEISSHTLEFGGRRAVLVMAQDITERLRAEERFQLAVEAAPNAMVMVDQQGKIILVNRQTEKLFGYARDELIGQRVEMLVPPQARGVHANYRTGFFASPQARPMGRGRDLHGLRRDGSQFPVEIGLTPVETEEGILVLSAIVDITTHKQAEAKLAESLARERVARAEAEAAHQNLAFLVEASSILSESFDYPQRLELMAHIAVPTIADWCAIDILEEDGGLRRVAVAESH